MRIFVVVPAYQAESTLEATIERIPRDTWNSIETLLVLDDGSRDGTSAAAERLRARHPLVRLVRSEQNRGYGPTVRDGLAQARSSSCDVAAVLHADGQYAPELLLPLATRLRKRSLALLQGSRHRGGALAGGMPLHKFLGGKALCSLERRVLGLSLTDFHSGYILHGRGALDRIPYERLGDSFDFDLQIIACAAALGLAVGEEPIPTRYADEVSHLRAVPYALRVLSVLRRFRAGEFHRLCGLPRRL